MKEATNKQIDFEIEVEMDKVRSRISIEQRMAMVRYVRQHPNLMKGRGKNLEHFSQKRDSWTELAKVLNGIPSGPKKSADKWLRSFQDWKSDVKAKHQRLRAKDPAAPPLTQHEASLLQLLVDHGALDTEDPLESSTFSTSTLELESPDQKPDVSELDVSEVSRSPPSTPELHRKKKRKRERRTNVEDANEDKEERAIRAMEHQATSLDRMATAMERVADAVTMALDRFTNANNNRQYP